MFTLPYRTLIHQKRWATNGLNAVIAGNVDRLPADEQLLIRRLLDHIQVVDEIFRHNLESKQHSYAAPRSAELPSLEALASSARATGCAGARTATLGSLAVTRSGTISRLRNTIVNGPGQNRRASAVASSGQSSTSSRASVTSSTCTISGL